MESSIEGLKIIEPAIFEDHRGYYFCTYRADTYSFKDGHGKKIEFIEDDMSYSTKGVLRGMHGDDRTWKLIWSFFGEIFFAVADLRVDSPTYLKTQTFYLGEKNRVQILVPPGCVNGHLCMGEYSLFCYKQSEIYQGSQHQVSVAWNDPKLNIQWPIKNPILSKRDSSTRFMGK